MAASPMDLGTPAGLRTPPASPWQRMKHAVMHEPDRPLKKNELRARWKLVSLLCMALFASYYVFDIPAATESALASAFEGRGGLNNTSVCVNGTEQNTGSSASAAAFNSNFNLLYSVYSWPNVVLPFLGGYISDKLGVRLMGVIFMSLMALGQLIVALGSSYISSNTTAAWYTMFVGRTVFGFGGESLGVVQSAFIASYFQGKELAFAMGVNLALARVGSVVNNLVSAAISSNAPVYWAYWAGAIISGLACLAMVAAYYTDVNAENRLRASKGLKPLRGHGLWRQLCLAMTCRKGAKTIPAAGGAAAAASAKHSSNASVNGEGSLHGALLVHSEGEHEAAAEEEAAGPTEEIKFSAVCKFPPIFWVLTLSCLTVYIDVLTFNNNCSDFVTQKYLTDKPVWLMCEADKNSIYLTANSIMSITYLVAGFMTPLFGSIIDNLGGRAAANVLAATAITGVHLTLGLTNFYPAAPLVALGICYSIYASALWPSIAIVIKPEHQATAYGLVTAVQNMGLAISPMIVGLLMPDPHCATYDICVQGWTRTEWFFVYLGMAGIACGLLLNLTDHCISKYPMLNLPEKKLQARMRAAGDLPPEQPEQHPTTPLLSAAAEALAADAAAGTRPRRKSADDA